MEGGPGTEPEPEAGTVGTVLQEPNAEPEPPEPFSKNRNRNRPLCEAVLKKHTKTLSQRGTAGTENRNRSNRSIPKP